MKDSIVSKLESLQDRYQEIAGLLADPDVIGDQNQFRKFSVEYSQLEPVVKTFSEYSNVQEDMEAAKELLADDDNSVQEMAQQEIKELEEQKETLELELQKLLLPKDPLDNSNVFIEIRAGTGGDEAAIFAGDLFRMYSRYAEQKRWQVEV
ncbi:MAG: PCRF domain-containing protein, partial [Pseudomonadota bacterium]